MSNRVFLIAGTRPEIIKLAPLFHALKARNFQPTLLLTAQQTDLTDGLVEWFEIDNVFRCESLRGNSLIEKFGEIALNIETIVARNKPLAIVVQGDTTSALAGALTAFYNHIDIIHVEAGLRCETIDLPFPEEANRRLIGQISKLNLAPTEKASNNLLREGAVPSTVSIVGNTVIDSLKYTLNKLGLMNQQKEISQELNILVTVHRRESFGQPLKQICQAINTIASLPNVNIWWPVHSNPAVASVISQKLLKSNNINLISPQPYHEMVRLLSQVDLILTDSGGIQEEALGLGLPVLVLRSETERPELIDSGLGRLVGTETDNIIQEVITSIGKLEQKSRILIHESVLGIGDASQKIAEIMSLKYSDHF